jgi:hypothetical protein
MSFSDFCFWGYKPLFLDHFRPNNKSILPHSTVLHFASP